MYESEKDENPQLRAEMGSGSPNDYENPKLRAFDGKWLHPMIQKTFNKTKIYKSIG